MREYSESIAMLAGEAIEKEVSGRAFRSLYMVSDNHTDMHMSVKVSFLFARRFGGSEIGSGSLLPAWMGCIPRLFVFHVAMSRSAFADVP